MESVNLCISIQLHVSKQSTTITKF